MLDAGFVGPPSTVPDAPPEELPLLLLLLVAAFLLLYSRVISPNFCFLCIANVLRAAMWLPQSNDQSYYQSHDT